MNLEDLDDLSDGDENAAEVEAMNQHLKAQVYVYLPAPFRLCV